jgi:hypothetical protein
MKYSLIVFLVGPVFAQAPFEFKTDQLVYSVGSNGSSQAIHLTGSHDNYLIKPAPFMSVQIDGKRTASSAIEHRGNALQVEFGNTGVEASIRVRELPQYLTFELLSITGPAVSSIDLASLPLTLAKYVSRTLASARDDDYAVAVIPLNLATHNWPGPSSL